MAALKPQNTVRVKSEVDGMLYTLVFEGRMEKLRVGQLKKHLERSTGIPAAAQHLTLHGASLHDTQNCVAAGWDESSLFVLTNPPTTPTTPRRPDTTTSSSGSVASAVHDLTYEHYASVPDYHSSRPPELYEECDRDDLQPRSPHVAASRDPPQPLLPHQVAQMVQANRRRLHELQEEDASLRYQEVALSQEEAVFRQKLLQAEADLSSFATPQHTPQGLGGSPDVEVLVEEDDTPHRGVSAVYVDPSRYQSVDDDVEAIVNRYPTPTTVEDDDVEVNVQPIDPLPLLPTPHFRPSPDKRSVRMTSPAARSDMSIRSAAASEMMRQRAMEADLQWKAERERFEAARKMNELVLRKQ
eukprot:Sspe_Gene.34439::Locus_16743_Transcript_1_1_Confidence_1.000_Length_1126::g.34439::m.34439